MYINMYIDIYCIYILYINIYKHKYRLKCFCEYFKCH